MIEEDREILTPFVLSWCLRNCTSNPRFVTPEDSAIIGTCSGIYPIDGWKPLYLEVPRDKRKKDITGRFNVATDQESRRMGFNDFRTIKLPVYADIHNFDLDKMRVLIKHWCVIGIPDDIPCISIALKCRGFYSDYREVQYVTVVIIWNDGVGRIVSLDWCEGPLEDCITPEWYIETTPLMNMNEACRRIQNIYENIQWDNPAFSI